MIIQILLSFPLLIKNKVSWYFKVLIERI